MCNFLFHFVFFLLQCALFLGLGCFLAAEDYEVCKGSLSHRNTSLRKESIQSCPLKQQKKFLFDFQMACTILVLNIISSDLWGCVTELNFVNVVDEAHNWKENLVRSKFEVFTINVCSLCGNTKCDYLLCRVDLFFENLFCCLFLLMVLLQTELIPHNVMP